VLYCGADENENWYNSIPLCLWWKKSNW
jgi:hypothetical protein